MESRARLPFLSKQHPKTMVATSCCVVQRPGVCDRLPEGPLNLKLKSKSPQAKHDGKGICQHVYTPHLTSRYEAPARSTDVVYTCLPWRALMLIYIYICLSIYLFIYVYTRIYTCTHMHVCIYMYVQVYVFTCTQVNMMSTCMSVADTNGCRFTNNPDWCNGPRSEQSELFKK